MAELSLNIFVQPCEPWVGVNYIHISLILYPLWTEISSVCGIFVQASSVPLTLFST